MITTHKKFLCVENTDQLANMNLSYDNYSKSTENDMLLVRKVQKYGKLDFIINDESDFTLLHRTSPENNRFYRNNVKNYF